MAAGLVVLPYQSLLLAWEPLLDRIRYSSRICGLLHLYGSVLAAAGFVCSILQNKMGLRPIIAGNTSYIHRCRGLAGNPDHGIQLAAAGAQPVRKHQAYPDGRHFRSAGNLVRSGNGQRTCLRIRDRYYKTKDLQSC